jgi:hypothetical protein
VRQTDRPRRAFHMCYERRTSTRPSMQPPSGRDCTEVCRALSWFFQCIPPLGLYFTNKGCKSRSRPSDIITMLVCIRIVVVVVVASRIALPGRHKALLRLFCIFGACFTPVDQHDLNLTALLANDTINDWRRINLMFETNESGWGHRFKTLHSFPGESAHCRWPSCPMARISVCLGCRMPN